MSKEVKIMAAVGAVIILGAVWLFFKTSGTGGDAGQAIDQQALLRTGSHGTGKVPNKVTLIEFGDFQCPACATAHPIINRILDHYKGSSDFTFVFRNFPLTTIHPNALMSAQAAEAAGEQGKYWQMNNKLYDNQTAWAESTNVLDIFVGYAKDLGLDDSKFKEALQNGKFLDWVNQDQADGEKLAIDSTPTFFLNGTKLVGVPNYDDYVSKIDALLK